MSTPVPTPKGATCVLVMIWWTSKNFQQFVDFIEARNMRLILVAGNKKTLESHSKQ